MWVGKTLSSLSHSYLLNVFCFALPDWIESACGIYCDNVWSVPVRAACWWSWPSACCRDRPRPVPSLCLLSSDVWTDTAPLSADLDKKKAVHTHLTWHVSWCLELSDEVILHSASIPTARHFLSRQSWHFLLMYMSISQLPPLLHWYTAFLVTLRLKKPAATREWKTVQKSNSYSPQGSDFNVLRQQHQPFC